jgi:hypothetical protein
VTQTFTLTDENIRVCCCFCSHCVLPLHCMHLSRSFCSGSGGTLPIKIDICQGVSYMFSLMTYGLFVYMWNSFGMTREIHSLHIDYSICLKHLKKNRKNDAFEVVFPKNNIYFRSWTILSASLPRYKFALFYLLISKSMKFWIFYMLVT